MGMWHDALVEIARLERRRRIFWNTLAIIATVTLIVIALKL